MNEAVDWSRVAHYLDDLYTAADGLNRMFPGRSFSLDGHLVGSVGEVVAAYAFDLELNAASIQGHDARASDGRKVEIKLTQGHGVGIRSCPEHLIVLQRLKGGPMRLIYNGPGLPVWNAAGRMQKNGQRRIALSTLATLNEAVAVEDRLPVVRRLPV